MFTLIFNANYITFSYPQIRSFTVPNWTTINKYQSKTDLTFFF